MALMSTARRARVPKRYDPFLGSMDYLSGIDWPRRLEGNRCATGQQKRGIMARPRHVLTARFHVNSLDWKDPFDGLLLIPFVHRGMPSCNH